MVIAEETVAALRRAGHEAEIFQTPTNRFGRQFDAYRATALTDVSAGADGRPIDRIVTLRYPAFALRHPNHIVWLTHTMREYYDLWETTIAGFGSRGRFKETLRRWWIHRLDRRLLTDNARRLFTISRTVTARLRSHIGVDSEPIHPPAPDRRYQLLGHEPFVLGVSRLHALKRFDVLIRALRHAPSLRVVIAGEGEAEGGLRALAGAMGVADRVEFRGAVSEAEKLELLGRCRAVFFAPWNEDYGFVTLEAMSSGKPVITAPDSGGPTELVEDGRNGWVVAGDDALGARLQRLALSAAEAEAMAAACFATAAEHSWDRVAQRLTGE
jgi:glycosyltransferase involved in cell wall biosynthesis